MYSRVFDYSYDIYFYCLFSKKYSNFFLPEMLNGETLL